MKIDSVLEKLESWHKKDIEFGEDQKAYDFFPHAYGVSSLSELLEQWDYSDADDKWVGKYTDTSTKQSTLLPYRDAVAYLSAARKELMSFYLSGSDSHVMTDVDALRVGPHHYWNCKSRIDRVKIVVKEK